MEMARYIFFERSGLVLSRRRALPGTDLSIEAEDDANAIAASLALRLWKPAREPFRPVEPDVWWLSAAPPGKAENRTRPPLTRRLFEVCIGGGEWLTTVVPTITTFFDTVTTS